MSEDAVIRSYKSTNNQTYAKYCAALLDTVNQGQFIPPAGANGGPVAGLATNSILGSGMSDFVAGVLQYTLSGTAWPSYVPGSGINRVLTIGVLGIFKGCFIGTGTIAPGDRLVVGDVYGRIVSMEADGLNLSSTTAYLVGTAEESATVASQLFRVRVNPTTQKV
jgi:hypothetical protein